MHLTLTIDTTPMPSAEGGGEPPDGSLGWAVDQHFGSMEKLIAKMNAEGVAVQGSGWVICSIIIPSSFLKFGNGTGFMNIGTEPAYSYILFIK